MQSFHNIRSDLSGDILYFLHAKNKSANPTVHQPSQIKSFIVCCLEIAITTLANIKKVSEYD